MAVAEFAIMVLCFSGVLLWCGVLFSEIVARHDVRRYILDQEVWRNDR